MDSNLDEEKIIDFCEITGTDRRRALFLLGACNFDLQAALNYHLEAPTELEGGQLLDELDHLPEISVHPVTVQASTSRGTPCSFSGPSTSAQNAFLVPQRPVAAARQIACDDNIRAPIVPREDILIDSAEALVLNRRTTTNKRGGSSIFDSFRDFRVEGNRQEELVHGNNAPDQKMRRLEDIFRPPLDLMFHGSFQEARDTGVLLRKFVMVNIQNTTEFCCQVLNRDIWSDPVVKMLISENFIFWQVFHDTLEGSVYSSFYHASEFPYVSIIDPRTGELVQKWNQIVLAPFIEEVLHFIQDNPCPFSQPSGLASLASDASGPNQSDDAVGARSPRLNGNRSVDSGDSDKARTAHTDVESVTDRCSDASDGVNGNSDDACSHPEAESFSCSGKIVHIRLQYPDQSRELLTFPVSGTLRLLQHFLRRKGYPPHKFQYVTYMPKRALNKPRFRNQTFMSLDMIANESVYVHPITHDEDKV